MDNIVHTLRHSEAYHHSAMRVCVIDTIDVRKKFFACKLNEAIESDATNSMNHLQG